MVGSRTVWIGGEAELKTGSEIMERYRDVLVGGYLRRVRVGTMRHQSIQPDTYMDERGLRAIRAEEAFFPTARSPTGNPWKLGRMVHQQRRANEEEPDVLKRQPVPEHGMRVPLIRSSNTAKRARPYIDGQPVANGLSPYDTAIAFLGSTTASAMTEEQLRTMLWLYIDRVVDAGRSKHQRTFSRSVALCEAFQCDHEWRVPDSMGGDGQMSRAEKRRQLYAEHSEEKQAVRRRQLHLDRYEEIKKRKIQTYEFTLGQNCSRNARANASLAKHSDEWRCASNALRLIASGKEAIHHSGQLRELLSKISRCKGAFVGHNKPFNDLPSVFRLIPPRCTGIFLEKALPVMAREALAVHRCWPDDVTTGTIAVTARQCFAILSAGFFCLFKGGKETSSSINFTGLVSSTLPDSVWKLCCFMVYFNRMAASVNNKTADADRTVVFQRLSVPPQQLPKSAEWAKNHMPLLGVDVKSAAARIEDSPYLQADFANRVLGGGTLGRGCVQEEIRFAISPELLVSRAFMEPLKDNESALIVGAKRFSSFTGYARSFRCTGPYDDQTPLDNQGWLQSYVVALDAVDYGKMPHGKQLQYTEGYMLRELNKAYVALTGSNGLAGGMPFASGNWGCGVFEGDPQLKALLQLMACSVANRALHYFPIDDARVADLARVVNCIRELEWSVGNLWTFLVSASNAGQLQHRGVFRAIFDAYRQAKTDAPSTSITSAVESSKEGSSEPNKVDRDDNSSWPSSDPSTATTAQHKDRREPVPEIPDERPSPAGPQHHTPSTAAATMTDRPQPSRNPFVQPHPTPTPPFARTSSVGRGSHSVEVGHSHSHHVDCRTPYGPPPPSIDNLKGIKRIQLENGIEECPGFGLTKWDNAGGQNGAESVEKAVLQNGPQITRNDSQFVVQTQDEQTAQNMVEGVQVDQDSPPPRPSRRARRDISDERPDTDGPQTNEEETSKLGNKQHQLTQDPSLAEVRVEVLGCGCPTDSEGRAVPQPSVPTNPMFVPVWSTSYQGPREADDARVTLTNTEVAGDLPDYPFLNDNDSILTMYYCS
ncbi:unnamed protein product [Vitrella brassicaformis CCMP3155]|uniref:poly(ADP-ribose) glycohydrolase n=1 Tax=Vitrella brassicaformis (strain CCMP3155) TaxID=1169540 RepID=A0A0G4ESR7_VITBC|nr:unnamed protein product [Vitrella brassicaformis CCMP3155]|eukprot:CEM00746.1 unnamed protein product [Vitrella brassicaformis CCMP3155]